MLPSNDPALATRPIRYLNRDNTAAGVADQALAGWYYIAVKLSPTLDGERTVAPVPVQLDIDIVGQPDGGPAYSDNAAADGVFGTGAEPLRSDDGEVAQAAEANDDSGVSPALWIAAGAVVLVVASVAATVLVLRRARN